MASVDWERENARSVSAFIGRDEDLHRLVGLMAEHRLVTVVGPGGIGKTRLGHESVARIGGTFADGIRACTLAPLSSRGEIGAEVAGQLGFPSVEAMVLGLAHAQALLVLDNCEHVRPAAARLCHLLLARCAHLRVLATSREPLGVHGEQVLVLGPLGLPAATDEPAAVAAAPAVRLFADRARAAGASWDPTGKQLGAVAELCRRLDGVPLAIELAASRARSLTATELLEHLGRRFDLLSRAESSGPARHASLRAAIEASYDLLDAGERAFFRALGIFAGPFDAALAHAVAGRPGTDRVATVDLLSRLVDRSLIVAEAHLGTTRYRLLESLRHYAADAARAAGEWDGLGDRFVAAMADLAERIAQDARLSWSARLLEAVLAQFHNLSAAIELCLPRDATAARAACLLMPLWGAIHQGRAAEVSGLCDRVLTRWPQGGERGRPILEAVAASAHLVNGRLDDAIGLASAALGRSDAPDLARVLASRVLGIAARHRGDVEGAIAQIREAVAVAQDAGLEPFRRELEAFLVSLAPATAVDGPLDMLRASAARAIAEGDSIGEVRARLVAAHLLIKADRRDEARAVLDAVDRALSSWDYPYGRSVAARLHAVLATLDAGWSATRGTWRQAINRIAGTGHLGELVTTLRTAAVLALGGGDRWTAEVLLAAVPRASATGTLGPPFDDDALRLLPSSEVGTPAAHLGEMLQRLSVVLDSPGTAPPGWPALEVRESSGPARESHAAEPQNRRGQPDMHGGERANAAPAAAPAAMARAGDVWAIRFAGRTVQVRHVKGLDDLARLLEQPEQQVHCIELIDGTAAAGETLPSLDARGRQEYRARIRELQQAIDEAEARNDPVPAEHARAELDALVRQLSASFGLGGRARGRGAAVERARSAVAWRIRSAITRIATLHAELGRHLDNAVRTGTWCAYRPERRVTWQLTRASS